MKTLANNIAFREEIISEMNNSFVNADEEKTDFYMDDFGGMF